MAYSNFHTHCTYCDGKDTPRELVEYAVAHGCTALGFSSHSWLSDGYLPYFLTPESEKRYKAEIRALQAEYADRIRIYLGVERDYFTEMDTSDYDYVIGSVHDVFKNGVYCPTDASRQLQLDAVRRHYGGDFYAFAEDYFALVGQVYEKTHCDIVGHFDLITKFNEKGDLFSTAHPRYIAAADAALEKLMHRGLTFEVNTGAISRGYRKTPYPEPRILAKLRSAGEKIIYTSDCHDKKDLLCGLPEDAPVFCPRKK